MPKTLRLWLIGSFMTVATIVYFFVATSDFNTAHLPEGPSKGTYGDISKGMTVDEVTRRLGPGENVRYSDDGQITARFKDADGQKLDVTFTPDSFDRSKVLVSSKEKWP